MISPGHPLGLTLGTPFSHSALRPTYLGRRRAHTALHLLARPRGQRRRNLVFLPLGPRAPRSWGWGGGSESEEYPGFREASPPRQSTFTVIHGALGGTGEMRTPRSFSRPCSSRLAVPGGPGKSNIQASETPWLPREGPRALPLQVCGSRAPQRPRGRSRDVGAPLLW